MRRLMWVPSPVSAAARLSCGRVLRQPGIELDVLQQLDVLGAGHHVQILEYSRVRARPPAQEHRQDRGRQQAAARREQPARRAWTPPAQLLQSGVTRLCQTRARARIEVRDAVFEQRARALFESAAVLCVVLVHHTSPNLARNAWTARE